MKKLLALMALILFISSLVGLVLWKVTSCFKVMF